MRLLTALLLVTALSGCGDVVVGRDGAGPATATATVDAAPLPCPDRFPQVDGVFVPADPTAETGGRLVPDADPVSAVVCRYENRSSLGPESPPPAEGVALVGQVELRSGLDRVRSELHLPQELPGQSRSCTLAGGPLVPHLMRLDYADGSVWVSSVQDVNACNGGGNGEFTTAVYLGTRLAEAYDAAAWVPAGPLSPCSGGARAGQERALVPPGWTSLAVCESLLDAPPPPPRPLSRPAAEQVVDLLAAAETGPGSGGCSGGRELTRDGQLSSYLLVFAYPDGPPVQVRFTPDCDPALANGSLDAVVDRAQQQRLERLVARS